MKHPNPAYERFFAHLPSPDESGNFDIPAAIKNLSVCASCITEIRLKAHKERDVQMLRDVHIFIDELTTVKSVLSMLSKANGKQKTFFIPQEKNA